MVNDCVVYIRLDVRAPTTIKLQEIENSQCIETSVGKLSLIREFPQGFFFHSTYNSVTLSL